MYMFSMLSYFNKNRGFSLAEVLITLGIIGVISAMTIPGLLHRYQATKYRSQLMKTYSTLQQVIKKMDAEGDSLDPTTYKSRDGELFYQTFQKYLSSSIDCGNFYTNFGKGLPCHNFSDGSMAYKNYIGNKISSAYFDAGQLALPDGTLLLFENMDGVFISVDINGAGRLPNRWGYDLFTFQLLDSELLPVGATKTKYNDVEKYCSRTSSQSFNGIACAEKAIKDSNYFKEIVN